MVLMPCNCMPENLTFLQVVSLWMSWSRILSTWTTDSTVLLCMLFKMVYYVSYLYLTLAKRQCKSACYWGSHRVTFEPKSSRNSSLRCENATRCSVGRGPSIARPNNFNISCSSTLDFWYWRSISCRYNLWFDCRRNIKQNTSPIK